MGDRVLDFLAADPDQGGLFLDFDGTLTPIVDDPASVRLPARTTQLLEGLASRLAVLAVVSGRPAAFLHRHIAAAGTRLLGIYGLEEWCDGKAIARPEAGRWQAAVREVRERLSVLVADLDGVSIEDKGLSVAVHWRNATNRQVAGREVERLAMTLAEETGLAREPGKLVEELRPPVSWDKGAAVRALVAEGGVRRVVYVGDDRGDLAAFGAVHELGGVCVAVDHGPETPAELRAAADTVVTGHDGVAELLEELRSRLG